MPSPVAKKQKSTSEKMVEEDYCINVIRMLSADQPTAAKSGHPGAPIACAPMAHVLYRHIMKYNPRNPKWSNRDRFVLSNGHACALQYSMLHVTGYDLTLEDLKSFRQYGSKCPGHPENQVTPGIEVTTGPLGQGVANAVGLAIAEKHLAAEFNRDGLNVVDHYTYCICGDGCLQEGVSTEASSLAGHLGLGKLILLYDDNRITIDGPTSLSFSEDVLKRYEAYGWHTQTVEDGMYGYKAIEDAIKKAKSVVDQPSIIKIHTIIGMNTSVQNSEKAHGTPLTEEDLSATKKKYGLKDEKFYVPQDVYSFYDRKEAGKKFEMEWNAMFKQYEKKYPNLAMEFKRREKGELPAGWEKKLPTFAPSDKPAATRKFSETVLNAAAGVLPELMGGSADLTPSNLTKLTSSGDFQKHSPVGRYLRFGIREHGMAAISNGIFAHGLLRPFCATFLNFIGYALGAVRLSAVSEFGVLYIATHDSIFLGEDGPTHQPIEMIPSLRALPNLCVFRPADGNEVTGSYICALEYCKTRPSVLALSRSNVPNLTGSSVESVRKGGYILCSVQNGKILEEHSKPNVIIVATGSEVSLAVKAAELYKGGKVRIVSMPCRELFDEQPLDYKQSVLGRAIPVMSIEAAGTTGWNKFSHMQYGIDSFGQSGSPEQLEREFHLLPTDVVEEMNNLIKFYTNGKKPHDLFDLPRCHLPYPKPHKS